jgi:hypothetical protein
MSFCGRYCLASGFDQGQETLDRRNPVRALIGKDATAIRQNFEFMGGVPHSRPNAVLRFEFALQAPGQAS